MGLQRSEIEHLIGKESGPIKACDDVSTSNVRHWYEMMKEPDKEWIEKMRNIGEKPFPYLQEAKERVLAEQKEVQERPVPLAMIMTWARDPYWSPVEKEKPGPHEQALKTLEDAGYALTLGIELDEELVESVSVGDWLTYDVILESVSSEEEETRLGKGYLVKLLYTFSNRKGEVVSKHRYTVLKAKKLNMVS